jgi:hypothetical protein
MRAEERTIDGILTEQICYEIPPYQRPYSWKKEHVQQFLEDIWEAYEVSDKEYFIGSLIAIEKEKNQRYEVVDGQQRLTTLNLIFARLRDHIKNEAAKQELGKRILPRNVLTGEAETPRLILRKSDQTFFRKHVLEAQPITFKEKNIDAPQQRIAENLDLIDEFFKDKNEQSLKLFANYILKTVFVVFVNTDSWKSAYRLFNVLNARGLSLSNADLIKNELFSLLGTHIEKSYELEDRWIEIEQELGVDRLDAFFGHHRTSVTAVKARGSLHEEFDPIIKSTTGGPFVFLDGVIASAKNYMRIVDVEFSDPEILRSIRELHRVEYDEWIPPLLAFLNKPIPNLPESEFISLLEKITMQNWVRRLGRAARLTAYFQLVSAINSGKSSDEVREIFRKNAQNKEFLELLGGEVYGKPFDSAVLLRMEEAAVDGSVTKSYGGRLTIEHVMPQALKDDYWKKRFTEEQHKLWLHRLGNLAMLSGSKNYKSQYYDFDRKKKIYSDRDKNVSFDLTKEICLLPEWTEESIKKRQDRIMKLAENTYTIA